MAEGEAGHQRPRRVIGGLSGRLLWLTIAFALLAQALILGPSLAEHHDGWLSDRVRAAELASLAVELSPDGVIPDVAAARLLRGAGVVSVALEDDGIRRSLLAGPTMPDVPRAIDLRGRGLSLPALLDPWRALASREAMLRVQGAPQFRDGEFIEIVVPAAPLRADLAEYLRGLFYVSLFVSALTGSLVWLTLSVTLVRPMQKITESIARFRADPNDPTARVELSGRSDEIGRAETELSRMQAELRAALHSRTRLAALGEAVAKINHDLRNMLTGAQLASDRLSGSEDPHVAVALPRLERALDRAISLTEGVLAFGRSVEPEPQRTTILLARALADAADDAGLADDGVRLETDIAADVTVNADANQFARLLVNLLRNAREAIEGAGGRGRVVATHVRDDESDVIRLTDDGPGIPERAQSRLFQAFGSARTGGTGLGLAIARELARAHGGDLRLVETGPTGTAFELRLPV